MKKTLLLAIILCTLSAHSQNKFGIFAGLNYSYLTQGFAEETSAQDGFGLQIGALYEMELNKTISFRPKLVFSQQGDRAVSDFKSSYFSGVGDLDYKLTYLNVPLDFKFWNKIYLLAGPQVGFLINTKKGERDYGDAKSDIDLGFNLGGGFTVNKLFFELGLYQGFTSVLEYSDDGDKVGVKNGLAKFTIGYSF